MNISLFRLLRGKGLISADPPATLRAKQTGLTGIRYPDRRTKTTLYFVVFQGNTPLDFDGRVAVNHIKYPDTGNLSIKLSTFFAPL